MSRPLGAWNLDRASHEVKMMPAHLCLRTALRIRCGHSYIRGHAYTYVFPPLHPDDAGPGSAWVECQVGHVCKALGEGWGKSQHHLPACNLNPSTNITLLMAYYSHCGASPLYVSDLFTSLLRPGVQALPLPLFETIPYPLCPEFSFSFPPPSPNFRLSGMYLL